MNPTSMDPHFADLAHRVLDGQASASELARFNELMLQDACYGREFASISRFETTMRLQVKRQRKALLEFAALEAAMDIAEEDAPLEIQLPAPRPVIARKAPSFSTSTSTPWLRIAAIVIGLGIVAAVLINLPKQAPVVATAPGELKVRQTKTMLAPRLATGGKTNPDGSKKASPEVSLAERLNDFYLPSVNLEKVSAKDAGTWLTQQLHQRNYARRPELDTLTVTMPASAAKREVTMKTGNIAFSKAVSVIASLAGYESEITPEGVQINERPISYAPSYATLRADPSQVRSDAAALGIALNNQTVAAAPGGGTRVFLPAHQQNALATLAEARQQITDLPPMKFVPMLVPGLGNGPERVLTASEVASIREQLASANPGSLPTLVLRYSSTSPFSSQTSVAAPPMEKQATLASSNGTNVIVSVSLDGEQTQVTISEVTADPHTMDNSGNQFAASSPTDADPNATRDQTASSPPADDTVIVAATNPDEGVAVAVNPEDPALSTPDGTPVTTEDITIPSSEPVSSEPVDPYLLLLFVPVL